MKSQSSVSLFILVAVFIILSAGIAGCVSQTPSAPPVTQQKLSTIEPSQMGLEPPDVPADFTLVEKYERNASDLSDWALEHGWKKGYGTYYTSNGQDVRGMDQVISVYPVENISLVIPSTLQNMKDWSAEENMSIEVLPAPSVGDSSSALRMSEAGDPIDLYMIAFVKYDVYEELWINGTAPEYDTLKQVAHTAAAKIQ